jgi:GT2 family glycosyltransferase
MQTMSDLAIIMPTRNRPEVLARSLALIRARGFKDTPIYVFDDASGDAEAVANAAGSVPGVTLIRSEQQLGPAGGRNRLLHAAQASWCLALDDDCYPREDFDIAQWISIDPHPSDPIIINFLCFRPSDGDLSPKGHTASGPTNAFHGGASLLHRESILNIGGYRDFLVFGLEDTELALRTWASGYQVWIDPENVVIHEHVAGGRDLRKEAFYYVKNRILVGMLTAPLYIGIPHGFVSAARRIFHHRYPFTAAQGLANGLWDGVRYFNQRKSLTFKQWRALRLMK